jgi:hypothetical protein
MSTTRQLDPHLRAYLQYRIRQWLEAEPGRTSTQLADLAGVSRPMISDAMNKGILGWKTMTNLLPIFDLSLGTVHAMADEWAENLPADADVDVDDDPPSGGRAAFPRLSKRPEWPAVAAEVLRIYRELDEDDVVEAGRFVDHGIKGPLDAPTLADFARAIAARRRRIEKEGA